MTTGISRPTSRASGINRLTARAIEAWLKGSGTSGRLADGGNLYLERSSASAGCSWVFIYTSPATGKRRYAGLGAWPTVGLAAAREKAHDFRDAIAHGNDPIAARRAARVAGLTFADAAIRRPDGREDGTNGMPWAAGARLGARSGRA